MFATKSWLGLFAIAAGGILNASTGEPESSTVSQATTMAAPEAVHAVEAWPLPSKAELETASGRAVLAELRHDLRDNSTNLRLTDFRFDRASSRSIEGTAQGIVLFDETTSVPIVATAIYDVPLARIEHVAYQVADAEPHPGVELLGKKQRDRIADLIGSRLVLEFSQQPVDFSLLTIDRVSAGRERMVIGGSGITRFRGEGAAFTRFIAIADKSSGRVIAVKYDLMQEIGPGTSAVAVGPN